MLNTLMSLASMALPGIVTPPRGAPGRPASFTIRIPENHPRAEQLVKLFKFLETRVVMPSGIELSRPGPLRDPVAEFLDMLRDVVDDKDSFDQAMEQLVNSTRKESLESYGLRMGDAGVMATLLEGPLINGFLGKREEEQGTKAWVEKAVRKLRDRG